MESYPLISVIVPVFNGESYIDRCLKSIVSQDYNNWELILVNDGSTDRSGEICETWGCKDKRISVLHKINGGGVSSARNFGLQHIKGKWITFVDIDETINQGFFSEVERCRGTDLIVCGYNAVDEIDGSRSRMVRHDEEYWHGERMQEFLDNHIQDPEMMAMCFKYFKADIIKSNNIRFNERVRSGEDTLFVTEYLQYVGSVAYSPLVAYNYYLPPKNTSPCRYKLSVESALEFVENYWPLFHKLTKNPSREERFCMYKFWDMEAYNLIDKSSRSKRHLWFESVTVKDMVAKTPKSSVQSCLYWMAENLPWSIYSVVLRSWMKINQIRG